MAMAPQEIVAVVQEAIAGKRIQRRYLDVSGPWIDDPNPSWNFQSYEFRVKPEPFECWLNEYAGLTRSTVVPHLTSESAIAGAGLDCIRTIHVREITDEQSCHDPEKP